LKIKGVTREPAFPSLNCKTVFHLQVVSHFSATKFVC